MKVFVLFSIGFLLVVPCSVNCFKDRKLLVSRFEGKTYKSTTELKALRSATRKKCLNNLYSLPLPIKHNLTRVAERALKGQWEPKLATDYMLYFKKGNRNFFESKLHAHTGRIAQLMVGQLLDQENNSSSTKFMDEIVNGLWMLMEDSTWVYPAHLYLQGTKDYLPVPGLGAVDLNAGEDAKFVAWVKLMLHDKFDQISPVINQRIDYELKRRIFDPFLQNDHFFWLGFSKSHNVNNWNIWINGNILKAAWLTLTNETLFAQVANRTVYSADFFLDNYGNDGGCNEGPAYWRQAGGRLIEYIDSLTELYDAKQYFKSIDLIKNIGEYSYKMHIDRDWFVNFADAIPMINYPPSLIAKFGLLYDDDKMKHFAAYMNQFLSYETYIIGAVKDINEFWNFIEFRKLIESYKPEAPEFDHVWFPDIEVVTTRSKPEHKPRTFVGAKFGNNHESHNHNDVGSFVLYQNGSPVLIDIGVGTYNATTFGQHRFDIYYFQSGYHNCPTINGVDQKDGQQFSAKNVSFVTKDNNDSIILTGDLAGAYPKSAHVHSWQRTMQFNRTSNVFSLEDKFHLDKFVHPQQLNFVVVNTLQYDKKEYGLFLHNDKVQMDMHFDWNIFEIRVEERGLDHDHHLTQVWGDTIRRISLVTRSTYRRTEGNLSVSFSPVR